MPIYAYRCTSCGHAKDVLQKMSDEPLSICPACGQATFQKQLTAAGFQLKGSGWYVTDFRGGNSKAAPAADAADAAGGDALAAAANGATSDAAAPTASAAPAGTAPAPSSSPAPAAKPASGSSGPAAT